MQTSEMFEGNLHALPLTIMTIMFIVEPKQEMFLKSILTKQSTKE